MVEKSFENRVHFLSFSLYLSMPIWFIVYLSLMFCSIIIEKYSEASYSLYKYLSFFLFLHLYICVRIVESFQSKGYYYYKYSYFITRSFSLNFYNDPKIQFLLHGTYIMSTFFGHIIWNML